MDNFTATMLERAGESIPHRADDDTKEWFSERGLDEDTVYQLAVAVVNKSGIPVTKATCVTVGITLGIELGKMMSDPSWPLARELSR